MVAFEIPKSSKVPPRTKFYGALGSNLRPSLYGGHEVLAIISFAANIKRWIEKLGMANTDARR